MPAQLPYGSWPSPLQAADLVSGTSTPVDLHAEAGTVWWSQTRPDQGGRVQLVRRDPDGTLVDVLPGESVRTRVHEYGGAAWWVHRGVVFACRWADQRLCRVEPDGAVRPITPEPARRHALRYADGRLTPDGGTVVCVRERHTGEAATDVRNELVALAADPGAGDPAEPVVLFGSADFVAAPRISPDGTRLAWLSWDHPQMPWTETRLWVAQLSTGAGEAVHLHQPRLVAGGFEESLVQPEWAPDGTLYVVSDRSGWWNVYRVPVPEHLGARAELEPVHPVDAEVGLPAWTLGQSRFAVTQDGTLWSTWTEAAVGTAVLAADGPSPAQHRLPFSSLDMLRADGADLLALASSTTQAAQLLRLRPVPGGAPQVEVLRAGEPHGLPEASVSVPRKIDFPSAGGRQAHGWLYLPRGVEVSAPAGELPPLVVTVHGGPTSAASPAFRPATQYWTTRGFAVVDVDYGGSTGHGRPYRDLLDGAWGVVDVQDVCAAARHLAEQGLVDPDRLVIRGGSAGGFTVLAALAGSDTFAAGASHYGVADLAALARDTHKFESRYLDGLVGPWPAAAQVYAERSPLAHLDGFRAPLIVLQGSEDAVVPPAQAEAIVAALAERGVPHAYLLFEGEQHGFRRAENIVTALESELVFYGRVLGFTPAGELPDLDLRA